MRKLILEPEGWPCCLCECPPGLFLYKDDVCFKDEYGEAGNSYCSSGEIFWGGKTDKKERALLVVQPIKYTWIDE